MGKPNQVNFTIATKDSRIQDLLKIVEHDDPSVLGKVSFRAAVNLNNGPGKLIVLILVFCFGRFRLGPWVGYYGGGGIARFS